MYEPKPIICTLTDEDLKSRKTTWREVMRTSVSDVREIADGYTLILGTNNDIEAVRQLTRAESACCEWMSLELSEGAPSTLKITSESPGGKAVIKEMLAL